jgi:signal transduction histidine kinase
MNAGGLTMSEPQFFGESPFSGAGQKTGDDLATDPNLQTSSSAESVGTINPSFTDLDQFELMRHRKRGLEMMAVCIGIPVLCALTLYNFTKGDYFATFLNGLNLLIAVFLGLMAKRKTDKEFDYKIYSILFRLFIAVIGTVILYHIGFQSSFGQIEWCYIYPILVFFAVGSTEGMIWVFVFYGILAFFMLNFDLQRITVYDLQEFRYRFLASFFVVSMLSLSLQQGFRFAQERLLSHQRNLRESENRYRQAYQQLNTQMQERKQAEERLQRSEEEAKRLAQENAIMAEIGRIISSTLEIDEVYDRFAGAVRHLIDFDRIAICIIDAEHQTGIVAYEMGKEIPGRRLGEVFPLSQSVYEHILKTRSGVLVQTEGVSEMEKRYPFLLASLRTGFRSMISVPLISKDRVIGGLNLRSFKPNAYTERDLKIAENIGIQIAGAIANTLLFADRKRMEAALREKTEKLARSNEDLEQFAYVASHDLQEPLRMVTSYVQLLAKRYKSKLDADANEFIDFAVDGAIRMRKLINDLLTYSGVGTQGKELSPTDSEAVLAQSVNDLKLTIEDNEALVTHDPLPTVMADRPQLGQLFQNLIGNAIKFRGNEPPRVHISASRNGSGWIFSVRDNGIGIAPEYSERIFIIFQRLHSRQEYAGTGIGLAICKKIVERHGGHIWVESEVGKGATFRFSLQAARA